MKELFHRPWLKPVLEPLRPVFLQVMVLSFAVNLLALAVPIFVLQVYDRVVFSGGLTTLQGLVIGIALVLAFDYVLKQARGRILQTVALRIDVMVGRKVFDKCMSLPLNILESRSTARWQAVFRDIDVVRNALSGASAMLVADLPFAVLFLALAFVIAPPIAWVLLAIAPLFMLVAWRSGKASQAATENERGSLRDRDALMAEIIIGRTTVKALALDRALGPLWEEAQADTIRKSTRRGSQTNAYMNLGASLTMATTVLLTSVGAIAILEQQLTIGGLIAVNMLSGRLLAPLNQLVSQWKTFTSFGQSAARLDELLDLPSERIAGAVRMERPQGRLAAEGLTFAFGADVEPVVRDVSFEVAPGRIVAIVGQNGSGKTTLLKLLSGLYRPGEGKVFLDGGDVAQFSRFELADWFGAAPQECVMFAGSVRDNIAHRKPAATDAEVLEAAKLAGAHDFIVALPDGFGTDIGEAGRRLSAGQRQRLAIARALLGQPPILVFDEPTSNLDRKAELQFRDLLNGLRGTHTVLLTTHSPILLAACDDLVALEDGRVVLSGTAKEILPQIFGPRKSGGQSEVQGEEEPSGTVVRHPAADSARREGGT